MRMWSLCLPVSAVLVATLQAFEGTSVAPPSTGPNAASPDHLVLMVFDQMRPDYIDRFDLTNFKRLRASARHYPDAYVGHLGSQTVVAHVVIPTGLRPGALPWQEEAVVDSDGVLGRAGAVYKTGELTRAQYFRFLGRLPRA